MSNNNPYLREFSDLDNDLPVIDIPDKWCVPIEKIYEFVNTLNKSEVSLVNGVIMPVEGGRYEGNTSTDITEPILDQLRESAGLCVDIEMMPGVGKGWNIAIRRGDGTLVGRIFYYKPDRTMVYRGSWWAELHWFTDQI